MVPMCSKLCHSVLHGTHQAKKSKDRDLSAAISVRATTGDTVHEVRGALYHIGDRVEARVVQIDDYLVEVTPSGHILLVGNQDRPGVIGAVGSALGKRGINVGSLHVGQDKAKGTALALWRLEADLPEDAMAEIRGLPQVKSARCEELVAAGKKQYVQTMKLCADCGDICAVAANIVARHGALSTMVCEACAKACDDCGKACAQFADDEHMKKCADECKKCAAACREMIKHAGM